MPETNSATLSENKTPSLTGMRTPPPSVFEPLLCIEPRSSAFTLFYIRTPFFGEALMFLFFLQFKPKNVLSGFLTIFVYIYNKDYRNIEIKLFPMKI